MFSRLSHRIFPMIFTVPKLFCLQVAGPPEFLKCHATDPIPTRPPRQRSASSFTESVSKYVPKESQEQRPTSTGKSWILVSSATHLGARFGLYSLKQTGQVQAN